MSMIRTVSSVCLLLFLAACGGGSKVAGAYVLDTEALVTTVMAQMKDKMPKDADAAQMKAAAEGMAKQMSGTMDLTADGKAALSMTVPMAGKIDASGTWTEASGTVTIKTKEGDKPEETKTGKVGADGAITVSMDQGGMKVDMVFKRK